MTQTNEILLRLLDEIDDICNKEGLSYFLAGNTLRQAYKKGQITEEIYVAEVLMPLNDIFVLQEKVKHKANRTLESIFTNKEFKFFFFKYVADDTLYFNKDLDTSSQACGIHVRIRALKKDPGTKESRKVSKLKRFWYRYHRLYPYEWEIKGSFSDRVKQRIVKTYIDVCHDKYYESMLKQIVDTQKNFSLRGTNYINYLKYNKGYNNRIKFPKDMFVEYTYISVDGHKYRTVKNIDKFLFITQLAEESQKTVPIVSTAVSHFEYTEYLKGRGLSTDISHYTNALVRAREVYKESDIPAAQAWRKMQRAVLEKKLGSEIQDIKKDVLYYYEKNMWNKLGEALAEFDAWSRDYAERNIALDFDEEIMTAYLSWLDATGERILADKIRRNIELEDEE